MIKDGNWDYVFSASRTDTPPERMFSLNSGNLVEMHFPEHQATRTQDILPSYYDAGQFYFGRSSSWATGLQIFSSKSTIVEIPRELSVDIDTVDDWHHAERLFETQRGELE